MEGNAGARMGPIHFLSHGYRGARLTIPPALSSGEVAEAMLWLPLPTHHPFDLPSSPDVPSGSHQLCGIHPAVQESSSLSHFLSRTQRDPRAGTALS